MFSLLVACAIGPPSAYPTPTSPTATPEPALTGLSTSIPVTITPGIHTTPSTTVTTSVISVTPSPSIVPIQSKPITPSNVGGLIQAYQHQFSPWDLVHDITWSPDGGILAVAAGESVYFLNPDNFEVFDTLNPGVWTPSIAISPASDLLVTGGRNGNIDLWDISSGEVLHSIEAHRKGVNSVTFNPRGGSIASGGNDAVARLWDIDTGNNIGQMIGGTFAVPAISFTPDGQSLAIVNGQVIRLRDVASSRFVVTINGEASFNTIDISPDGLTLAAGDSVNVVTLWDISGSGVTQTPTMQLETPDQPEKLVWKVKFSPDGQILASAHNDGTINLWDLSKGKLLAALSGPSKAITSLAFSPDGRYLATGSLDGSLSIWVANP